MSDTGYSALIRDAMENPPFWVGAIFVLVGCGISVQYINVNFSPYANYVLVGLGFILLLIGILPYTGKRVRDINVRRLGIAIEQPSPNQLVRLDQDNGFLVAGIYRRLPKEHQIWLISLRDGAYRPHAPLDTSKAEKRWRANFYTTTREPRERKIGVYVVGPGGKAQIDTYFHVCSENKREHGDSAVWPGIKQLAPDIVLCEERNVILQ